MCVACPPGGTGFGRPCPGYPGASRALQTPGVGHVSGSQPQSLLEQATTLPGLKTCSPKVITNYTSSPLHGPFLAPVEGCSLLLYHISEHFENGLLLLI